MKQRFSLYGLIPLLLAGCTAAQPAASPAAAPNPAAATRPAVVSPTLKKLAEAPEQWWLLDPSQDSVPGTGTTRAYRELLADREPQRTVVVAIIDSGIDIEHEDLRDNIWRNEGEARDGRDTDGNGYADDVHGWSFIGGATGDVKHDTYEVTRLYVRKRARFANARADTLAPAAHAEFDRYRAIRREFESERSKAQQMLAQMQTIETAFREASALLRQHTGEDTLSVARVQRIQTTRNDVMRARQLFLQLDTHGINEELLEKAIEHFEGQVAYGYNPDFDPRHIVGDDYADPRERIYGNTNVRGPRADHGTHVAAIVGAVRGNGIGIDGIAPAVRIMPIRAVPDGDERDKDVANAIRYAVDNGAHIINMSFGKAFSPNKDVVDEAVRYADERGVLLIHAAGNDGADLERKDNFPNREFLDGGRAAHWISVGASSWKAASDTLAAPFSNFGRTRVDVFAPGVDIYSAIPDNRYEKNSGTSMAAPVVSGVAALLMAYFPELTPLQVREIILASATPFADRRVARPGEDAGRARFGELSVTGGVVNAFAAVRMADEIVAAQRAAN
jgi:subtilisin family serine protease